jgi:hypothetical protein
MHGFLGIVSITVEHGGRHVFAEQLRDIRFHKEPVPWECDYCCGAALKYKKSLGASLFKAGTSPSRDLELSLL